MGTEKKIAFQIKRINKSFYGTHALRDVSFDLYEGGSHYMRGKWRRQVDPHKNPFRDVPKGQRRAPTVRQTNERKVPAGS